MVTVSFNFLAILLVFEIFFTRSWDTRVWIIDQTWQKSRTKGSILRETACCCTCAKRSVKNDKFKQQGGYGLHTGKITEVFNHQKTSFTISNIKRKEAIEDEETVP